MRRSADETKGFNINKILQVELPFTSVLSLRSSLHRGVNEGSTVRVSPKSVTWVHLMTDIGLTCTVPGQLQKNYGSKMRTNALI